jgi:hypothetical protein
MKTTMKHAIRGQVTLMAYDADGNLLWGSQGDNLVVNKGRENAANFAATGDSQYQFAQIAFGTSDTPTTPTDTAIAGAINKAATSITKPAFNKVQVVAELTTSEGNGTTFREVGLLTANGDLYARRVFGSFDKTVATRLVATWTIQF